VEFRAEVKRYSDKYPSRRKGREFIMSTAARSALSPDARREVAEALQDTLVDLLDLSLLAKQAHWNLVGPNFRPIHQQLDEVADTARRFSDTVAERSLAIGVPVEGRAITIAKESALPDLNSGLLPEADVLATFIDIHAVIVERLRRWIELLGRRDPVSQDLLISITAELEKSLWMWQAQTMQGEKTAG
jgi:starvation-inducible DNA-binding protein